jgi:hypothetical protein
MVKLEGLDEKGLPFVRLFRIERDVQDAENAQVPEGAQVSAGVEEDEIERGKR